MSFDVDVVRRLGDRDIALKLDGDRGLTALVGRSGVGKTSVLNMIAGLLRPDRGHVVVAGTTLFDSTRGLDVPPERRCVGYVFQDPRLFPHLRVVANLRYGLALAAPANRWISLEEATDMLGIGYLLDRWPSTLSGGEARRVAIGRALLSGPRFLLMDEPLSSLDRALRDEVSTAVLRIRDALAIPILYVTHDEAEVEMLATRRVEMPAPD